MPRFVILRHDPPPDGERTLHWDFMLEGPSTLLTWALECEPNYGATIEARQLADHRLEYLQFQGTLTGGRGVVSRWDTGEFAWVQQNDGDAVVNLHGAKLQGEAHLQRCHPRANAQRLANGGAADDQRWLISFLAAFSKTDR